MNEKISLVFDTNFIVSNLSKIEDTYKDLSMTYDVFISEVSIQERLSHKYMELKGKYDKINAITIEHQNLVELKIKIQFDERWEYIEKVINGKYQELFGKNIIYFNSHQETLKILMDRAFRKVPPFSTADKASDKGFKDSLIWLSILEYFQKNGGNKIYFATDDKAFKNNSLVLCKEFNERTKKSIEIKDNDFFLSKVEKKDVIIENKPLPDFSLLRKRIHKDILALCCGYYSRDDFGNVILRDTFSLPVKVTEKDMMVIFCDLRRIIEANILDASIPANIAFNINNIVNECNIPIDVLQRALSLYDNIYKEHKDYLPQFFNAAANIFNNNYFDIPF